MATRCGIKIYDADFNQLNECRNAESVQFTRVWHGAGSFEVHAHPDKPGALDLCRRGNVIILDDDGYRSGVIQDFSIAKDRTRNEVVAKGTTGAGFCGQRLTVPPTRAQDPNALGWDKINAPAETVLKHYVSRNMTEPFDSKRKFQRLTMAADMRRGASVPWKSRYANLLDELSAIGEYGGMGFVIYADMDARQWVFDVSPGVDRSVSQTVASPVTFSVGNRNLAQYQYTESYEQYRSTGYAGGAGEDENRLAYIIGDDVAGRDRVEAFLECSTAKDITELIYYGNQRMAVYQAAKAIEADTLPRTFIYGEDFSLGDKVTVEVETIGVSLDTRVTQVTEVWEPNTGYAAKISFGGNLPNVFTILRQEIQGAREVR